MKCPHKMVYYIQTSILQLLSSIVTINNCIRSHKFTHLNLTERDPWEMDASQKRDRCGFVVFALFGAHQNHFRCDREAHSRIIMKCWDREGTWHIKIHNDPKDSCCFVALHSFKSCLTRATVGSFNCQQVLVSITGDRRLLQLHLFNFFSRYYTLPTHHMLSIFLY